MDEIDNEDRIKLALALCEKLVPGGRFERGPRATVKCSATSERKLRVLAKEAARWSTLAMHRDESGVLLVLGVKVCVRS